MSSPISRHSNPDAKPQMAKAHHDCDAAAIAATSATTSSSSTTTATTSPENSVKNEKKKRVSLPLVPFI